MMKIQDTGREIYERTELRFFELVRQRLAERMHLYCVTGSLATGNIVPEWSDIDVLIVIDTYDESVFQVIEEALADNRSPIKIGVTLLSDEEMKHQFFKPSRLYDAINLICSGAYVPRIHDKLALPLEAQKESRIREANIYEFAYFFQFFKKGLMAGPKKFDEHDVHKNMTILLKIILRTHGIVAKSYSDVAYNMSAVPGLDVTFYHPSELVSTRQSKASRFENYVSFLKWIERNTHDVFR